MNNDSSEITARKICICDSEISYGEHLRNAARYTKALNERGIH